MKDKTQTQLASLTQTRDTLVKLRTSLKNKVNNILSALGINLAKEAFSSEKKLNEVLATQFDAMVKVDLEVIIEEIRSLNQKVAKLDKTIADEGSKLEGHRLGLDTEAAALIDSSRQQAQFGLRADA